MQAHTKLTLIEMFLDRTSGESTKYNRLATEETEDGNVALIAYTWMKIAEYDESTNEVTIFAGHKACDSVTVLQYLNKVLNVAEDRGRSVSISGESPTVAKPNEGVKYIGNYIGDMQGRDSPVEAAARTDVHQSLA